jgi:hypothetical protein
LNGQGFPLLQYHVIFKASNRSNFVTLLNGSMAFLEIFSGEWSMTVPECPSHLIRFGPIFSEIPESCIGQTGTAVTTIGTGASRRFVWQAEKLDIKNNKFWPKVERMVN